MTALELTAGLSVVAALAVYFLWPRTKNRKNSASGGDIGSPGMGDSGPARKQDDVTPENADSGGGDGGDGGGGD